MTRKRFVKLLMARGYSRNEAAELARSGYKGQPYTELYYMTTITRAAPEFMEALHKAAAEAAEIIHRWCTEEVPRIARAVAEAAAQVIENIRWLAEAAEDIPSE